jgi:hypothetical protein
MYCLSVPPPRDRHREEQGVQPGVVEEHAGRLPPDPPDHVHREGRASHGGEGVGLRKGALLCWMPGGSP